MTHWSQSQAATRPRTGEGLSWPVRLGRVGFILDLKAPIPQEIQFRTKSRNVTPQCWAEICCGLGSEASGLRGWLGRGHWGCQGCGGLATCPNQSCPSPHLHLRWLREGLTWSLAVLPAGPPGSVLWPCHSVRAQQGAWGILVSGVCGVLAGSPAVWASWAAASFSQGGRARPARVMKATLSSPAQAGEGARGGSGGPQVTAQGLTLPGVHLALVPSPRPFHSLFSLYGLRMGHTEERILERGSGAERRETGKWKGGRDAGV